MGKKPWQAHASARQAARRRSPVPRPSPRPEPRSPSLSGGRGLTIFNSGIYWTWSGAGRYERWGSIIRSADMSYVLTRLLTLNAQPQGWFTALHEPGREQHARSALAPGTPNRGIVGLPDSARQDSVRTGRSPRSDRDSPSRRLTAAARAPFRLRCLRSPPPVRRPRCRILGCQRFPTAVTR